MEFLRSGKTRDREAKGPADRRKSAGSGLEMKMQGHIVWLLIQNISKYLFNK